MRKFLSSFWGMFAVLFALVLMGANTPLLIGNADYPISWFNTVRLVLPWRQATELPNQRVRIETGNTNWLRNPGFESATISPWTTSGKPTISFPSASYEGAQALSISQTSGSGKYVQGCVTTTDQVGGTNLEMSVFVMGSTASGYQVCSVVDGVEKQCVTAPDNGNQYTQVTATAIAPTTVLADDNVCIRIKSTSSGAVGIYVDEAYLGPNRNIGTVAQATAVAHGRIAGTTNCTPTRSSTSLGDFSTDADCVGPTVVFNDTQYGVLQTTDANLPQFTVNNLAPGNYRVVIGSTHYTSSSGIGYEIAISDGSTSCTSLQAIASNAVHGTYTECLFSYSTQADRTFKLQASSSSGSVTIANDQARGPINFFLYRYPSQSEQVLRMNVPPSGVWQSYTPTITSATGALTNYTVSAQWMRVGESAFYRGSITFTGAPGTWTAPRFSLPSGQTLAGTDYYDVMTQTAKLIDNGTQVYIGFAEPSGTDKIQIAASGSGVYAALTQTTPFTWVSGDKIGWIIGPLKISEFAGMASLNMPLIAGGVTSLSSSTMMMDGAYVTAAGAVTEVAGADWISQTSITPSSSTYTITFTKPYLTHPGCKANFVQTSSGIISGAGAVQVTDVNTTGLIVRTFNTSFVAANMPFYVECWGPR